MASCELTLTLTPPTIPTTAGQGAFDFPVQLTEKYQPRTIDDFVGLDKAKNAMRKLIAHPYSSSWLFVGDSGMGKTTLALAVARQMGAELHHVTAQSCDLDTINRLHLTCHYVPMHANDCSAAAFHVVLIDEIDRASMAAQIAMLSKLDPKDFPPNTIFIGTCNSTENLEKRFLSRWRILEFSNYGISSGATDLLSRVWDAETGNPDRPNFARLVKNANNNIRAALMALETEIMCA